MAIDLLVLSPHLDDAALSCGGSIHRLTARALDVLVVTVFTGDIAQQGLSPIAREVLHYMELEPASAMATRRSEDGRACAVLGAEHRHWPFLESVFRQGDSGEPFYTTRESIFGELEDEDRAVLLPALVEKLEGLPPAERILAPLGVGGHVDHLALRLAAETVFRDRLRYFEDFPYVRGRGALERALGQRRNWSSETTALESSDLSAKVEAIGAYGSQLKPLFRSTRRMRSQVRRFARKRSGERTWLRRSLLA